MNIGFTGSQTGMTNRQKSALFKLMLRFNGMDTFFHGDCIGADDEAHTIVEPLNIGILIHPGDNEKKRAFRTGPSVRGIAEPKPNLERNRDIVDHVVILIAAPAGLNEELRSGTWATVRYARTSGVPVVILDP